MKKVLAILVFMLFIYSTLSFSASGFISGQILDSSTKKPLVKVDVEIFGKSIGTSTDAKGFFEIKLDEGLCSINVSRIGYEPKIIPNTKIKSGERNNLLIEMTSSVIEMEQVVVTATREKSLIRDLPVFAHVISSADLERNNSLTVGEALQHLNGSYVNQYGGLGATESISLRGSSSSQVLVLWDGQKINSALSGGLDFGTVPIQSLERIETVHGSYSSIYGADAVGGVINLITRKPSAGGGFNGSINSTMGSLGLLSHVLNLGQNIGKWSYFLSANSAQSDGNFEYNPNEIGPNPNSLQKRENASYKGRSAFGKIVGHLSPSTSIQLLGELSDIERGVPGSLSFPTTNGFQEDATQRYHFGLFSSPRNYLNLQMGAHFHVHELKYVDESPFWPIESKNTSNVYGANAQGTLRLHSHKLIFGSSYLKESGDGSNVGRPERNNVGNFIHCEFKLTPFNNKMIFATVSPSVRYDYYSDFDNATSPKIGLLFAKAGEYNYGARASWGRSFHAPSFNDLYWIGDAYTTGNPDLLPETAKIYDFGFRFGIPFLGGVELDAGYFEKNAEDLILWAGDMSTGKWKPQNVSSAKVSGEELRLMLPTLLKRISSELNYTHLDAINKSGVLGLDGNYLIYRPRNKVSSVSSINVGPAQFTFSATHIGERYADEANTTKLDAVLLLDADVGFKVKMGDYKMDIVLSLKNISDKGYQVVYDYPMPGRMWRVKFGLGI
jgi:outer membrane cobalamin receptor